jgi:hypothetical protein
MDVKNLTSWEGKVWGPFEAHLVLSYSLSQAAIKAGDSLDE